uniref:separase n=2 Tax=Caenorhabditis tropicalis TaxID=1561998 RepID=A0A1I7TKI6_9PELO
MKVEYDSQEFDRTLQIEVHVLSKMKENRDVLKIIDCGKRKHYTYMVTTLCGKDLMALRLKIQRGFNDTSAMRVALFTLYGLKQLHEAGFVHRDVKPGNIMTAANRGHDARFLVLIDFGMARSFVLTGEDGRKKLRPMRRRIPLRGTVRYCSMNVHERIEQGRGDDLIAMIYTIVFLTLGLPWSQLKDEKEIMSMKKSTKDVTLFEDLPEELKTIFEYLKTLAYADRPNYEKIYNLLMTAINRLKINFLDPYEWEDEEIEKMAKAEKEEKEEKEKEQKSEPMKTSTAKSTKTASEAVVSGEADEEKKVKDKDCDEQQNTSNVDKCSKLHSTKDLASSHSDVNENSQMNKIEKVESKIRMAIINIGPDKETTDKLERLGKEVNSVIALFIEQIVDLQQEVSDLFINEFGVNGPIDLHSLNKLARITSHYASSERCQNLGKFQRAVQKLFNTWQLLRAEALKCSERTQMAIATIPAKMSFFFFFNGELSKAVVCLLDYLELVPEDALIMEAALRWLLFLGETELAEKKMKKWKMNTVSEDIFAATTKAIIFLKNTEQRMQSMQDLIALRDKIKEENIKSFPKYELASYVSWLCSTLSNTSVKGTLSGCEFPDRISQLLEACAKAESIVRNRVPGLAVYQFDNTTNASIGSYLETNRTIQEYIHLGSTIAWFFEMRRELSIVYVSTAQARDAMSSMILNLRVALKSASFFRILQMTNLLAYYTTLIEEAGREQNAKVMKVSCFNLLSSNPVVVRCSTPKKSEVPSRVQTPLFGENSRSIQFNEETMMHELTDQFEEIHLLEKPFHPITRSCTCTVCMSFPHSTTFAAEYLMAYCIYKEFSQSSIKEFNDEFTRIRERGMPFQIMMYRDNSVRPRPNIIQNEIFGICVVQWLIKKFDAKELADRESLEIFKNAQKIVKYLSLRTTDLLLAVTQLGRQLEFPFDEHYSWMQPVVKKPRKRIGMESAKDLFFAVSPFGNRQKIEEKPVNNTSFNKERLVKIREEVRREMYNYGHVLYRDWRCRLFPYVGRISDDPWEAAYAWAESTLIGSRNAIQCRLEKCRKGIVTISGHERFKACVRAMPEDMTLVQIAMADNKSIHLIKLHADREPIIMPLADYSQSVELMDKFSYLLEEDERIAKYPGEISAEDFWKRRKVVDARLAEFVKEVESNFLNVAAFLLLPSERLGPKSKEFAVKLFKVANGGLRYGEAKEMVHLSGVMNEKAWTELILRFCEMHKTDESFVRSLPTYHRMANGFLYEDKKNNKTALKSVKKYTYLLICPHLSQFCWERLPIFEDFPYVGRQVSIHSLFSQLEALRSQEKQVTSRNQQYMVSLIDFQIPLQIDVQNAYYVLDPENNLGETKRRMMDYINKFKWEGTVGEAPNSKIITTALSKCDAFFYFGHGSGSAVMPRSLIKQSTCNAISLLMGCGSVRTIPQALGFDGKSALHDYAMAKCPLIVGCLWTVTDGEIDRFLMRMVDDCFQKTRVRNGIDKLRQLSEAMHEARSQAKLKYLTGAAVVMYGLPVVSKPSERREKANLTTSKVAMAGSIRNDSGIRTPNKMETLKSRENSMNQHQLSTPKRFETVKSKQVPLSSCENSIPNYMTARQSISSNTPKKVLLAQIFRRRLALRKRSPMNRIELKSLREDQQDKLGHKFSRKLPVREQLAPLQELRLNRVYCKFSLNLLNGCFYEHSYDS